MASEPETKAFLFQDYITTDPVELRSLVRNACLSKEYDCDGSLLVDEFPVVDNFTGTACYGDVLTVTAGLAFTESYTGGISKSRLAFLRKTVVGYIVCIKPTILHARKS